MIISTRLQHLLFFVENSGEYSFEILTVEKSLVFNLRVDDIKME